MKAWVGMDVGKQGAIVTIYEDGVIDPKVVPLINNEIDSSAMAGILITALDNADDVIVGIEDVHSIFNASAKSNFQFGRALGIMEGICAGRHASFIKIYSTKWQKLCFEGIPKLNRQGIDSKGRGSIDTKAMALLAVKRLYPTVDLRKSERANKPHEGIVDALLIAHYLKQTQR